MRLLTIQPNNRHNWVACVIATYLNKSPEETREKFKTFLTTIDIEKENKYEYSELLLFGSKIYKECGDLEEYESYIEEIEPNVLDTTFLIKEKVKTKIELGKFEESESIIKKFINSDPEDIEAHELVCRIHGFSISTLSVCDAKRHSYEKLTSYYNFLCSSYEKSTTIQFLRLRIANPDDFKTYHETFIRGLLSNNACAFEVVKVLYGDRDKKRLINSSVNVLYEEALRNFNLRSHEIKSNEDNENGEDCQKNGKEEWRNKELDFLVNILRFKACKNLYFSKLQKAEEAIKEALSYSPDNIEICLLHSKLHKKKRNYSLAFDILAKTRSLDLSDRYLNTKSVKAAIRAGKISDANEIIYLFLEPKNKNREYLHEMQYIWFDMALGKQYLLNKDYENAIKSYSVVVKYYNDMLEDQFDFHMYCFYKMTLRMYLEMFDFVKNRYSEKNFVIAAKRIVFCNLELYEKDRSLARLDKAAKFCKVLSKFTSEDIDVSILSALIYIEKKSYILIIRSIKKALSLNKESYKLHLPIVKATLIFDELLQKGKTNLSKEEIEIIRDFREKFLPKSIEEYLSKCISKTNNLKELSELIICHSVVPSEKLFDTSLLNMASFKAEMEKYSMRCKDFKALMNEDAEKILVEIDKLIKRRF